MQRKDTHKYDDIINLPHPVSASHPQMSAMNRAAQFAPFAALTGYGDAISETHRLTDRKIELDEEAKAVLDEKLQMLMEHLEEHPEVQITYFVPDERKAGGAYITVTGSIRKIDLPARSVIMTDGSAIQMDAILDMEWERFY